MQSAGVGPGELIESAAHGVLMLPCLQAEHYQQALAISPLHPDAWFALGYCRMKTDSPDGALQVGPYGPLAAIAECTLCSLRTAT